LMPTPVHIGAAAVAGAWRKRDIGPEPGTLPVPPITALVVAYARVWQVRDVVAHP
jgi:hypothetical protein